MQMQIVHCKTSRQFLLFILLYMEKEISLLPFRVVPKFFLD